MDFGPAELRHSRFIP